MPHCPRRHWRRALSYQIRASSSGRGACSWPRSAREACQFLSELRSDRGPRAIVVHDPLDAEDTLELLRAGAAECLGRPVNMTRLSAIVEMMTAEASLTTHEMPNMHRRKKATSHGADMSAANCATHSLDELPSMSAIIEQARIVAPLDATVLITGETGTGKTFLSRLIHEMSSRSDKRFVAVNCGALSASLVESELFGHAKGAFTGADRDHRGKFAQCEDGSLLLDEVDSMSLEMQVKLLQVVEERMFEPVGSEKTEQLRARLIVACNRNLEEEVEANRSVRISTID